MIDFKNFKITADFVIHVTQDVQHFESELEREIEAIWEKEVQNPKRHLFNGTLLSVVKMDSVSMLVRPVPYKAYLAQVVAPHLFNSLHIRPVSVSGITICEGKFLIGKRAESVTAYPGRYELAPSGGCDENSIVGDKVDAAKQVIQELKEETGIRPSLVQKISPFMLVSNDDEWIIEICMIFSLHNEALKLGAFQKEEYHELFWLEKEQVVAHMQQHHNQYVPTSIFIFNKYLNI